MKFHKMVVWDREKQAFFAYLNGECIGQASTYEAAVSLLNKTIYTLLERPDEPQKSEGRAEA